MPEKIIRSFTSSVLMRVGSAETINNDYSQCTLSFGCPANWMDFAFKSKNHSIGDIYECIFAHLRFGDPRIDNITDVKGRPMRNHLLIHENQADKTCLLRLIPTILTPVLCFYSFNVDKIMAKLNGGYAAGGFAFDLDKYKDAIIGSSEDASFLFIKNPSQFIEELKTQVPIAVEENIDNLTSSRFVDSFNPSYPITAQDVCYDKYTKEELFIDQQNHLEEMFWKIPEYEWQSELRVAITNLNFAQDYCPHKVYNYKRNRLTVKLPNLREYAIIAPANEVHCLWFDQIDKEETMHRFSILRMTVAELQESIKDGSFRGFF